MFDNKQDVSDKIKSFDPECIYELFTQLNAIYDWYEVEMKVTSSTTYGMMQNHISMIASNDSYSLQWKYVKSISSILNENILIKLDWIIK